MKCKSCGERIKLIWNLCPNCGTEIVKPTPDQARIAVQAIQNIKEKLAAEPDLSPDGHLQTMSYVDAISEVVTKYSNLLDRLIKLNEIVKGDVSVLREKDWLENGQSWIMLAKTVLISLSITSQGIMDPSNPEDRLIPPPPDGCAWISILMMRLQAETDELVASYETFIESEDWIAQKKAGDIILRVSNNLTKIYETLDAVTDKLRSSNRSTRRIQNIASGFSQLDELVAKISAQIDGLYKSNKILLQLPAQSVLFEISANHNSVTVYIKKDDEALIRENWMELTDPFIYWVPLVMSLVTNTILQFDKQLQSNTRIVMCIETVNPAPMKDFTLSWLLSDLITNVDAFMSGDFGTIMSLSI